MSELQKPENLDDAENLIASLTEAIKSRQMTMKESATKN